MNDPKMKSLYLEMPLPEVVKALSGDARAGSQLHEEIKGAVQVRAAMHLADAIDRHEKAATRLSARLLWLNIILGVFTVAGTVFALIALLPKPSP
jgi:hypothetical protein